MTIYGVSVIFFPSFFIQSKLLKNFFTKHVLYEYLWLYDIYLQFKIIDGQWFSSLFYMYTLLYTYMCGIWDQFLCSAQHFPPPKFLPYHGLYALRVKNKRRLFLMKLIIFCLWKDAQSKYYFFCLPNFHESVYQIEFVSMMVCMCVCFGTVK